MKRLPVISTLTLAFATCLSACGAQWTAEEREADRALNEFLQRETDSLGCLDGTDWCGHYLPVEFDYTIEGASYERYVETAPPILVGDRAFQHPHLPYSRRNDCFVGFQYYNFEALQFSPELLETSMSGGVLIVDGLSELGLEDPSESPELSSSLLFKISKRDECLTLREPSPFMCGCENSVRTIVFRVGDSMSSCDVLFLSNDTFASLAEIQSMLEPQLRAMCSDG